MNADSMLFAFKPLVLEFASTLAKEIVKEQLRCGLMPPDERKTKPEPQKQLLTYAEAAEFLGVKAQTLHNWVSANRHGVPKPWNRKFRRKDLEAFLEQKFS